MCPRVVFSGKQNEQKHFDKNKNAGIAKRLSCIYLFLISRVLFLGWWIHGYVHLRFVGQRSLDFRKFQIKQYVRNLRDYTHLRKVLTPSWWLIDTLKNNQFTCNNLQNDELTVIGRGWAKYSVLSVANTVGRHYPWTDHYLWAIICWSRGGLSAYEKEEKFESNDNDVSCAFWVAG